MEQDTIDLLKDLVAIDSQNPSLVPGAAGESRIAAFVADWAEGAGLSAEIREKLARVRPSSLGAAARIQGMTPAALAAIAAHVRKRQASGVQSFT